MSSRTVIERQIRLVATELERAVSPLKDELPLGDSGLDSLSFAILVARLEDELGVDPFLDADDGVFPETLGQFVAFYDRALA